MGFNWSHRHRAPQQVFVSADNDEARNPHRFILPFVSTHLKTKKSMREITTLTFLGFFIFNCSFGQNMDKAEANLDKKLVAILDTIYIDDQKNRNDQFFQRCQDIAKEYGRKSKELKDYVRIMVDQGSINLIKIEKILNEHGWLGADIVGVQGNYTLFLVIQHSDLETQEKYLPMMRGAVHKGNAKAQDLAFLEDRVALRKGERQIYGSQIGPDPETGEWVVRPLIDPDNVDKRRAEVGLGTLQDYISEHGMTWNVEEYKKQLPELEMRYRNYLKTK